MFCQISTVIEPIKLEEEKESDTKKRQDKAKKQEEKESEADKKENWIPPDGQGSRVIECLLSK